jgi:hypothetical protein
MIRSTKQAFSDSLVNKKHSKWKKEKQADKQQICFFVFILKHSSLSTYLATLAVNLPLEGNM